MEIYRIFIAVTSFIVGSVPFGYILAKSKGIDIRKYGSGNIGATNVYRTIGKKYGITTLLLDLLKGFMCVSAVKLIADNDLISLYISAISVSLGHDFSIFLKFRGGKGVATTYGSTLALSFSASAIGMAIWLIILSTTKYSSVAAILSFGISTTACFLLCNGNAKYVFLFLFVLMIFKHKENIKRFYFREERKLKI